MDPATGTGRATHSSYDSCDFNQAKVHLETEYLAAGCGYQRSSDLEVRAQCPPVSHHLNTWYYYCTVQSYVQSIVYCNYSVDYIYSGCTVLCTRYDAYGCKVAQHVDCHLCWA